MDYSNFEVIKLVLEQKNIGTVISALSVESLISSKELIS